MEVQETANAFVHDLPAIISSIGTLVAAFFAYNQYTKNKMTDVKIEKWKQEERDRVNLRSENFAIIFGELWDILHTLGADRVYIIQPHPLSDNKYLSIALEVNRKGISKMKPDMQQIPMAEVAVFARALVQNDFMYFANVQEIEDKRTRGILASKGTQAAFVKYLGDGKRWVGNIVCEFTRTPSVDKAEAEKLISKKANTIGYILPEFQ
jgi:hypothetical protein